MKTIFSKSIILICIFLLGSMGFAIDIVYPRKSEVTINSPSTFFVGSSSPFQVLKINGKDVFVHETGAFTQSVPLNFGRNEFKLQSGEEECVFVINRPQPTKRSSRASSEGCNSLKKYEEKKVVCVKRDNVPMRSTPVESGINRMSHLPKNVPLIVNGEKNNLYKVFLNNEESAWVSKSDVLESSCEVNFSSLVEVKSEIKNGFYVYKILLSEKAPYTLVEGNPFFIKIFNIENSPNNTAIFKIDLKQPLVGYEAFYEGSELVVKIRINKDLNKKKPLENVKIVIDAGHGGYEKGALGCLRTQEKDVNLLICKYLEKELNKMGANVCMTRNYDEFVSLQKRVEITKKENAEIFVSIHNNSLPDCKDPMKYRGSDVYYYYPQARDLAQAILDKLSMDVKRSRLHQASFAVVRNTSAVSVLVEVGYMINPFDNVLLVSEDFQKKTAKQIADGICAYFINKN